MEELMEVSLPPPPPPPSPPPSLNALLRDFDDNVSKLKKCKNIIDSNYFARIIERIIKKVDLFDNLRDEIDNVIEIMLEFDCLNSVANIISDNKEKFTVKRIKYFALFIVVNHYHSDSLKVLLHYFPWLLNTWIDNYGYTLLCICVKCKYKYLKNLLRLDLVKKYINVEDKKGNNPLFTATFDFVDADYEFFNILREIGGADVNHVNCNGHSVFDPINLKYKMEYLMQFLPNIKGETAFKLMLKRIQNNFTNNFDNKRCVICLKNFTNNDHRCAFVCGHAFHRDCWKDVSLNPPKKDKCILCPSDVTSCLIQTMKIVKTPNNIITTIPILRKPPTKSKQFRIIQDNDKCYKIRQDNDKCYSEIVRYEYLINDKWVDESLSLNL